MLYKELLLSDAAITAISHPAKVCTIIGITVKSALTPNGKKLGSWKIFFFIIRSEHGVEKNHLKPKRINKLRNMIFKIDKADSALP
ncbi:hypothetical protein GCM10022398_20610 [Acetobacter lovaniensis]|nr:hypothetical protein AA0474_1191 [Acetobacter lovaniensis NRIC 0474]